jgi:hypothetical protein
MPEVHIRGRAVNRGLAAIIVLALIAWGVHHANRDDPKPQAVAKTFAPTTPDDDANTLVSAAQLNDQWEKSFDKTGKYPDGQDPATHNFVLGALVRISTDSPSYKGAQALREKFSARQIKINSTEKAKRPPEPELPKLTIERLENSYGLAKATFRINNGNVFPIADIEFSCEVIAASGTSLRIQNYTIFDVIPAKGTKTVRDFKLGFWPDQGKSMSCAPLLYKRR